jgi:hypothetical protein
MQTLANFFESINRLLGVSGPEQLVMHPVFIGLCIIAFLYTLFTGMKYFAVGIGGLFGIAMITHYLYPRNTSDLRELLTYVAALGGLALVLVYLGFIRE